MSNSFHPLDKDQIIHLSELDQAHIEVQTALNKLVWNNENLRKQLVEDPKKVMEQQLGIRFESDINVVIIDQSDPNTAYYVLPSHPTKTTGEDYTMEELDSIAGGMSLVDSKMLPSYGKSGCELTAKISESLGHKLPTYYASKLKTTADLLRRSFSKEK